jgi:hypothetical protein
MEPSESSLNTGFSANHCRIRLALTVFAAQPCKPFAKSASKI